VYSCHGCASLVLIVTADSKTQLEGNRLKKQGCKEKGLTLGDWRRCCFMQKMVWCWSQVWCAPSESAGPPGVDVSTLVMGRMDTHLAASPRSGLTEYTLHQVMLMRDLHPPYLFPLPIYLLK